MQYTPPNDILYESPNGEIVRYNQNQSRRKDMPRVIHEKMQHLPNIARLLVQADVPKHKSIR